MSSQDSQYLLTTVNNALKVMDLLRIRSPLSMTEISQILKIDKTSVFRLLYTLERRGYVKKNEAGKYQLGMKFGTSSPSDLQKQKNLIEIASPHMKSCCEREHASVHLGILNEQGEMVTLHKEEPTSDYVVTLQIGTSLPGYCASMGKVILAYLPPTDQSRIISNYEFEAYRPETITSVDKLKEQLATIVAQGWASDMDERIAGFGCIAAPIFEKPNVCSASVGIVSTSADLKENEARYRNSIVRLGKQLSELFCGSR